MNHITTPLLDIGLSQFHCCETVVTFHLCVYWFYKFICKVNLGYESKKQLVRFFFTLTDASLSSDSTSNSA